ncbi:MAG: choice-of-anchor D domain-containing protein, partial [Pseudomonadota bacterium]
GVGAGAVTINADAQPAGKMDAWRRRISCLFGLTIQGTPMTNVAQYDTSGEYSCPAEMYFRADRLPFEGFIGWDASSNGNLAQVLQEPSLMGAYEGAGVTVVGRGVNQAGVPRNGTDLWGQIAGAGGFADGSRYVNGTSDCSTASKSATTADYGTGNFLCNPSSIDGVSVMNSSQGGGGIYLHGWNHYLQIANTRISANAGTLGGGINLGSGEAPPGFMLDGATCFAANDPNRPSPAPLCPPIPAGITVQENGAIPLQLNTYVHIHHNQIIDNASIGDALFSGSPAGAGGVTISAGSDFYQLDHNWIAANLTSSDGGGVAHIGVSFNASINNNYVLFNQANNPTLPVDGGGIMVMGAQHDRTLASGVECGTTSDIDCPPGMGEGTGPNLVIDANLILGNSAEDGSGGGLRLRQINGEEVSVFPRTPDQWYGVTVTNNIIVNNVAGWDGGGVSLQDAFKIQFVNNTVASNDTTASAGVLFKTLGAIMASSPPPGCLPTPDPTQPQNPNCMLTNGPHIPQPAGLVTMQNTPNMMAGMGRYFDDQTGGWANNTSIVCPSGYGYGNASDTLASRTNGRCLLIGLPSVVNDLFWQNRAFHVEIVDSNGNPVTGTPTPNGQGLYSHQNIVALLPLVKQTFTGQCVDQASLPQVNGAAQQLYWDVGVRMDGLPNANGHNLYFDIPTVAGGYTLEAAATAVLGGTFTQAAAATATVGGGQHRVTGIAVTNGGSGFTAVPTVTISGGGGSGATATATVVGGQVTAVTVVNRGSGYTTTPTVSFSVAGAGTVTSISVWNPGAGYIAAPTVTLVGGGGSGAAASAIRSNAGLVTGVTVTNPGSGYTSAPAVVFSGGGLTPNSTDTSSSAGIAVTAKNSIFSDNVNLLNTTAVSGSPSLVPASTPVQGQYCNGARIPPEQCSTNQGANHPGMCLGYFTPAGQSETFGVAPVFVFNGIKASATVDEGNNWINMTYGPLSLSRPVSGNGAVSAEPTVASAAVAAAGGAYTIMLGSEAIDAGANAGSVTSHDFFGLARPQGSSFDIGAMELPPIPVTIALTKTASVSSANPGNVFTYTISASNSGANNLVGGKIIDTLPAGITGTWTCAASGGASCASASGTGDISAASGGAVGLPVGGSVTFVINATVTDSATNGNRVNTVTLLMPLGYGNSLSNTASATVNVVVPPPTLTAINPVGMARGATLLVPVTTPIRLTGTWLTGATGIAVTLASSGANDASVFCNTLVIVSPTSATASCTAYSTATGGAHNVTITTPSGTSNAVSLNIVTTPPTLTVPNQPTVLAQPVAYKYANTVVGSSTGATFTLANPTGSGGSISVGVITLTGDYQLGSNNCTLGLSVAAGASCTFVVNFMPTATGTRIGNVSVDVPGIGAITLPMNLLQQGTPNLTGTGLLPGVLTSSPAESCTFGCAISGYNALGFGTRTVGTTSSATTFTYTNGGGLSLTVGNPGVVVTGDYAVATNSCPAGTVLAASASCTFTVTFTPTATGTRNGTVTVTSAAGDASTLPNSGV